MWDTNLRIIYAAVKLLIFFYRHVEYRLGLYRLMSVYSLSMVRRRIRLEQQTRHNIDSVGYTSTVMADCSSSKSCLVTEQRCCCNTATHVKRSSRFSEHHHSYTKHRIMISSVSEFSKCYLEDWARASRGKFTLGIRSK